jgi:hypothetical protein
MAFLLVSLDSVIFKQPENFVIQVDSGQQSEKIASAEKTCSPLFNKNSFAFDAETLKISIVVYRSMGSSLDLYGKCAPIIIEHLDLHTMGVASRTVAVQDFKNNNVGRLNITFELSDDEKKIEHRLYSLIDKINDTEQDLYQKPKPKSLNEDARWHLTVDVRSAVNLPLNSKTDHGLPSARV